MVLVIFDNLSMRKRVSCKSKGNKFSTFSAFFVDFVSSSFIIRFRDIFEAILGSISHHCWEKNPSENRLKKRGPPRWKRVIMSLSRGSQRGRLFLFFNKGHRLARALLEQNSIRFEFSSIQFDSISARARILVRICIRFQLELEFWFEFVFDFSSSSSCGSNLCPSLSWLEFEIESKNCSKMPAWVGFDSIAKVSKTIRNWIGFDCKSFENDSKKWKGLISKLNVGDLTRHWAEARRSFRFI